MEAILLPIFVCVILPVSIVLIIYLASINSDNKRAQVLIKAIEANKDMDINKLVDTLGKKPQKTALELLHLRLLRGCIFSLSGLCFIGIGLSVWILRSETNADNFIGPLIIGSGLLSVGISYLIVYFTSRKYAVGNQK